MRRTAVDARPLGDDIITSPRTTGFSAVSAVGPKRGDFRWGEAGRPTKVYRSRSA